MAILKEIQNHVDEIMKLLDREDCDENVSIHLTRNIGVIGLVGIEHSYYKHSKGTNWQKLPNED